MSQRVRVFRFGWHFGLFQAMMPVIGWYFGTRLERPHRRLGPLGRIRPAGHSSGGKAICEALSSQEQGDETRGADPTRGWSLVILSVATSIDALAVGISFGVMAIDIWYPAVIIGIITASLTTFGMLFGARLGLRFGRRIEVLGGIILIGIGLKILLETLLGDG